MRSIVLAPALMVCGFVQVVVAQSPDKAAFQRNLQWANEGQPKAELVVGQDYMRGRIVHRSYPAAHEWFKKASDAGLADATALLGSLRMNGWGEPLDFQGGLALVQSASDANSPMAKAILGSLYQAGKRIEKNPTLALQLYQQGASAGDAHCMALLGNLYLSGDGVSRDLAASQTMLERSALLGDEWGESFLADALLHGSYGTTDVTRALALFQASAKLGNPEALYKLGTLYEEGKAVPQDLKLAGHYYLRAGDIDFAPAESSLAAMYDLGIGFNSDKGRAYFWATLAAAQGDKQAAARASLLQSELSSAELAQSQQHIQTFRTWGLAKPN